VPDDWLDAAEHLLARLAAAVPAGGTVVGIGVDTTASTPLPTAADGTPLARAHPDTPHALAKLWKHHAAQPQADRLDALGGGHLARTGGRTSCEWLPAKAAELAEGAPDLWAETARFVECGDWLVWQLTGREARSACQAGYKAHRVDGAWPAELDRLVPGLTDRLAEPLPVGTAAGPLTEAWRRRTGLPGTSTVAVATIDAHAAVPAVGVAEPGVLVGALGTSACYLLMADHLAEAPGIAGAVEDGVIPGWWGYETGQAGFGDVLDWFVRRFCADEAPETAFARLTEAATTLAPGQCGLVALDWLNGARTPFVDPELSGLLLGLTLRTTPVDIWRALLEGLCFGARRVVETMVEAGLPVDRVVLTSGLAERNPLLLRLFADIVGRPVTVPEVAEATARGAAIHGALAAGVYPDFAAATAALGPRTARTIDPDPEAAAVYDRLYAIYRAESDRFAATDTMAGLRALRRAAAG
jgi:L-ribulokinase